LAEFYEAIVAKATATVAEVFQRQGDADLASILRSAKPWVEEIGPDQWNEEVMHHQLNLEVPVEIYASLEASVGDAENAILEKLKGVLRSYRHDTLDLVVIGPILDPPMTSTDSLPANAADHIWESGMLRLFISHVAAHKAAVGELKTHLGVMGVSGFVAHQDISPSLEWQAEIELALRTTQAALALLTPDFHASKWTDQEVGAAFARGVLIIPVDVGLTPYGFMGKYQALGGALDQPVALADAIVAVLSKRPATAAAMREGLVTALQVANTYKAARKVAALLAAPPREFSEAQINRIRAAVAENNQVSDATGVPRMLQAITG
jgi:hypothetical protein